MKNGKSASMRDHINMMKSKGLLKEPKKAPGPLSAYIGKKFAKGNA